MSQRQISAALGIPRSTISAIVCKWRESSMVEEQDSSSKAKKKIPGLPFRNECRNF
jgi:DNA-binding transcriptional regulator LsrR (DeoR family)